MNDSFYLFLLLLAYGVGGILGMLELLRDASKHRKEMRKNE